MVAGATGDAATAIDDSESARSDGGTDGEMEVGARARLRADGAARIA